MKKILSFVLALMLFTIIPVSGKSTDVTVYYFTNSSVQDNYNIEKFLLELQNSITFSFVKYDIVDSNGKEITKNKKLLKKVLKTDYSEVPCIIIGKNNKITTFNEDTYKDIEEIILKEKSNDKYVDIVEQSFKDVRKDNINNNIISGSIIVGVSATISIFMYFAKNKKGSN